jgi:hypothetical protein
MPRTSVEKPAQRFTRREATEATTTPLAILTTKRRCKEVSRGLLLLQDARLATSHMNTTRARGKKRYIFNYYYRVSVFLYSVVVSDERRFSALVRSQAFSFLTTSGTRTIRIGGPVAVKYALALDLFPAREDGGYPEVHERCAQAKNEHGNEYKEGGRR